MKTKNDKGQYIINLDIDGVLLNSVQAVIELYKLYNREEIESGKIEYPVYENVDKWNFNPVIDWNNETVELAFEQELFFDIVPFECDILLSMRMIVDILLERDDIELFFQTKGTKRNVELKRKFISKHFPTFNIDNLIGIDHEIKGKPHIEGLIHVDDSDNNFNGGCKYNLLYVKNNKETEWNTKGLKNNSLYKVTTVTEIYNLIIELINFEKMR